MKIVILLTSIYACLETAVTGYLEYKENNNQGVGIFLYILAAFCLIVPNLVVWEKLIQLSFSQFSQNQFFLSAYLLQSHVY